MLSGSPHSIVQNLDYILIVKRSKYKRFFGKIIYLVFTCIPVYIGPGSADTAADTAHPFYEIGINRLSALIAPNILTLFSPVHF